LNGSYKNALFNLAILNIETKKEFSKAVILLERFIQLEPSSAIGHFRYAQCLDKVGDKTKAKTEFAKAKELDPNNPEIVNQ
jgi:Flp pilus assembly protein TadD